MSTGGSDYTPVVSLIVCTRNRAAGLRRCLAWLNPADFLAAPGELVVVDNGSTDATSELIRDFAKTATFAVQTVCEPTPGQARARNAGMRAARGEILAFIDDDCYPASDHIQRIRDAFRGGGFDYCGGRIFLYDERDAVYTHNFENRPRTYPPGSFLPTGCIQGCNMAMHRRVMDAIGCFDPMLGPGTPFRGDDIDYLAEAALAGFAGAHVPELLVYHHHGRKDGSAELTRIKKGNDFTRGAYYAKFALRGHRQFLHGWWRATLQHKQSGVLLREVLGACTFLWMRWCHLLRLERETSRGAATAR